MAQNKLENQIRERLNSREIQPSAQAWDRLDAMLTVAEEKKTKRSFGWLYIAAGITVLLAVGTFFFSQKSTGIQPQNNVADTEIKKDSTQKEEHKFPMPILEKNQKNKAIASDAVLNNHQKSINNNPSIINQKTTINQSVNHQNQIIKDKQNQFQNNQEVAQKEFVKTDNKKEINHKQENLLTDEQLLAGLDTTAKQSANKKTTVAVNAKNLLSQVDGELELTFREKAINKISKNYKEIKVALANRNNE